MRNEEWGMGNVDGDKDKDKDKNQGEGQGQGEGEGEGENKDVPNFVRRSFCRKILIRLFLNEAFTLIQFLGVSCQHLFLTILRTHVRDTTIAPIRPALVELRQPLLWFVLLPTDLINF